MTQETMLQALLTSNEYSVLAALDVDPVSGRSLARRLHLAPMTVNDALGKFLAAGFVVRERRGRAYRP